MSRQISAWYKFNWTHCNIFNVDTIFKLRCLRSKDEGSWEIDREQAILFTVSPDNREQKSQIKIIPRHVSLPQKSAATIHLKNNNKEIRSFHENANRIHVCKENNIRSKNLNFQIEETIEKSIVGLIIALMKKVYFLFRKEHSYEKFVRKWF